MKLPDYWTPDETILKAIEIFRDCQVTSSSMLVDSIEGTNVDLSEWIKKKRNHIKRGSASPKDVSEILVLLQTYLNIREH